MIKLAIVRKRYTPFGGAERFISQLILPLLEMGVETTVIAESWTGEQLEGVSWIKARAKGLTRISRDIDFYKSVTKILKEASFDLVQTHERYIGADICRLGDGLHCAWLDRYRSTLPAWRKWLVGIDPFHQRLLTVEAQMFANEHTHFVANSTLIRDEAQKYFHLANNRISVIPNGVDTDYFQPATLTQRQEARRKLSVDDKAVVISAVGSGFHRKGMFELVRAANDLPKVKLFIAGKDKQTEKLKGFTSQLGLSSRVHLLGPVREVRDIYWASDVFALPSLYDPSSNAVIEALSCGLPVVTTENVGSAKEISRHRAGIVCRREPTEIKAAILECAENASSLGANARALAMTFAQKNIVSEWLDLYRNLLRNRCEINCRSSGSGTKCP